MEINLKGIAWDHPRGYEPLRALSKDFSKQHPTVNINWDVRSLKEYGDMPIEELIDKYDLITIDHPYMGQAHKNQLLLNLNDYIPNEKLKTLENQYVGPCFDSYKYQQQLYALPIDAAALVAAKREDLFLKFSLSTPNTQDELKTFHKDIPSGHSIAWALCPTDMWCSFLTLCAQEGGRDFIKDYEIAGVLGAMVIDILKFHLDFLHPESINWNPIQLLDNMVSKEEIIYAPYLFGYTNYSRSDYTENKVTFLDSPVNPKNSVSTILGGVGLAVSANCKFKETTVEFVEYVASPEIQEGSYFQNQGQPAGLSAWQSEENNTFCNNFFSNTIKTMKRAYVRPRHEGWNAFQEQGADIIHSGILKNLESNAIIKELNKLYKYLAFKD